MAHAFLEVGNDRALRGCSFVVIVYLAALFAISGLNEVASEEFRLLIRETVEFEHISEFLDGYRRLTLVRFEEVVFNLVAIEPLDLKFESKFKEDLVQRLGVNQWHHLLVRLCGLRLRSSVVRDGGL